MRLIQKYKKISGLVISFLFYIFTVSAFSASYSYNVVNTPVGFDSSAQAINNLNTIIGTQQSVTKEKSAWLFQNGSYTTFAAPGNCTTTINGITTNKKIDLLPLGLNDSNTIVGQQNICGKLTGFKLSNGVFKEIQWVQSGITRINDINNIGMMVGSFNANTKKPVYFSFNGFKFKRLAQPANAINDSNYIIGGDSIYDSLAYRSTKVIKPGAQRIELTSINNIGQITGVEFSNNAKTRQSFVYDSSGFSTINYPGSLWTIATGINDQGVITGWVSMPQNYTANGLYTGGNFSFTATPTVVPDPNGSLPLPRDVTSPTIGFEPALDIEFSAQELGSTLSGDFNSDGSDDLIIAHTVSQKLSIYFGQTAGNSLFNDSKEIGKSGLVSIGYVSSLAKADFDEDGLVDLVIGSQQCNNDPRMFMVARSLGNGSFTTGACLTITTHAGYHDSYVFDIAVADFNEDKHQDIAVSRTGNYGKKQILIYFGNGNMTFSTASIIYDSGTSGERPYNILAADINNDGHSDLLVEQAKYTANATTILYQGNGTGIFPVTRTYLEPWPQKRPDMNKDGYPDKLVSADTKTLIYFGNSTGNLNYKPQVHNFASANKFNELKKIIADFNGDGQLDVLVANRNRGENVLGKAYFQTRIRTATTVIPAIIPKVTRPVRPMTKPVPQPVFKPTVDQGSQITIQGIITAVNTSSITVNGTNVNYTNSTLIIYEDGTGGLLSIGQTADVQGFKKSNGTIIAFEIGVSP